MYRLKNILSVSVVLFGLLAIDRQGIANETDSGAGRRWTRVDGRQSDPAQLRSFDPLTGEVVFSDASGKRLRTAIKQLTRSDQMLIRSNENDLATQRSHRTDAPVRLVAQNSDSADQVEIRYEKPRENPSDPIRVIVTREESYTVQVPVIQTYTADIAYKETYRCVESAGLFGHRRRVVYRTRTVIRRQVRTRTVMNQETRTRSVQSTVAEASLMDSPNAATEGPRVITLSVPKSAGAIASKIKDVLDQRYPPNKFVFNRAFDDRVVDYQQRSAVNGRRDMVRVEIQVGQEQQIQLQATVENVNSAAAAEAATLFQQIKAKLES